MFSQPDNLSAAARRGVRWTTLNAAGVICLQLLQISVLARLLEPGDFGQMAMLLIILGFGSTFAELGLSSAIIQRADIRRSELGTLYVLNLLAGALLFLVLWIGAPAMSALLELGEMTDLIRGTAIVFLISPWGMQHRAMLQKKLEFQLLSRISLTALCIGTVVAVTLAFMGAGVWALLGGYLVTEASSTVMLIVAGIRHGLWSGLAWDFFGARSYLAFGGFGVSAMLANNLNARIDQLAVGNLMGATSLGFYNVAQRFALEPVQKINPIVTRVAFPIFALAQHEPARLRRGYLRMNRLLLGVNAPLLFALSATAHLVVPVFLGSDWTRAVVVVQILAFYALLRSIGNGSGALIIAMGRADWNFYWNAAKLLIVPGTVWFAVQKTGSLAGVSITLVVLQAALLLVHYLVLIRRLIGRCGPKYLMSILRPVTPAALMGIGIHYCDSYLAALPVIQRLAVLIVVGMALYAIFVFFLHRELLREFAELIAAR